MNVRLAVLGETIMKTLIVIDDDEFFRVAMDAGAAQRAGSRTGQWPATIDRVVAQDLPVPHPGSGNTQIQGMNAFSIDGWK